KCVGRFKRRSRGTDVVHVDNRLARMIGLRTLSAPALRALSRPTDLASCGKSITAEAGSYGFGVRRTGHYRRRHKPARTAVGASFSCDASGFGAALRNGHHG